MLLLNGFKKRGKSGDTLLFLVMRGMSIATKVEGQISIAMIRHLPTKITLS